MTCVTAYSEGDKMTNTQNYEQHQELLMTRLKKGSHIETRKSLENTSKEKLWNAVKKVNTYFLKELTMKDNGDFSVRKMDTRI